MMSVERSTSIRVNPTTAGEGEDDKEEKTSSIFTSVFRPIISAMRIFGMFSDNFSYVDQNEDANFRKKKFLKIYNLFILIVLGANLIRMILGLKPGKGYAFNFQISCVVWYVRCLGQALYMSIINWPKRKDASKFTHLIKSLDAQTSLQNFQDEEELKALRSFRRIARIILIMFFSALMANGLLVPIGIFVTQLKAYELLVNVLYLLESTAATKALYSVIHFFVTAAWIAPTAVYCLLCESFAFLLFDFERKVHRINSTLSLKHHISEIRPLYLQLSSLTEQADNMFGPLALSIYFFDIVQFSFSLYTALYSAKSFLEIFLSWFWVSASLFGLLFVSLCASRLYEKGRKVTDILQELQTKNADAESNAELSLLLYHLSGDPVVLTIWKLIPLNKSIIVSVFISLITYFALLLQFQ